MKTFLIIPLLMTAPAGATVLHSEVVNGEFSDDHTQPTLLTVNFGSNEISGALTGRTQDFDFFTITVPFGLEISEIRLLAFEGGGRGGSFLGVQPRAVISNSPFDYLRVGSGELSPSLVEEINFVLLSPGIVENEVDFLPQLVIGLPLAGASPLPSGEYAFWLNETGPSSTYTFDIVTISVPEPSSSVLLAGALCCLLTRRRGSMFHE